MKIICEAGNSGQDARRALIPVRVFLLEKGVDPSRIQGSKEVASISFPKRKMSQEIISELKERFPFGRQ